MTTILKNIFIYIYRNVFLSLGKGRKKKIYNTDSDEISHIVNCIAPQVNITSFIITLCY